MTAAIWLAAGFLAFVAALAGVIVLQPRKPAARRVAGCPALDPEVARIIGVINLFEVGGRVCLCCRQPFVPTGAANKVCLICTAASDDDEWRDAA